MKYKKLIFLFSTLLVFCSIGFGQSEQPDAVSVIERKPDKFFGVDFGKSLRLDSFFWDVFFSTQTPAGIVFAYDEDIYEEKHQLQPVSFKLNDILDSFVKVKSDYSWNEINGVINVFPVNDYSILNTKIAEFKVEKTAPAELYKKIVQTSEFQSYIKERNLIDKVPGNKYGLTIALSGKVNKREEVSIDVKNATVREILNEAVRQRKYGTWTYREYKVEDEGIIYNIYRLENQ